METKQYGKIPINYYHHLHYLKTNYAIKGKKYSKNWEIKRYTKSLSNSHLFYIDKDLKYLLSNTKNPNSNIKSPKMYSKEICLYKLPFDYIFLEVDFENKNTIINGIVIESYINQRNERVEWFYLYYERKKSFGNIPENERSGLGIFPLNPSVIDTRLDKKTEYNLGIRYKEIRNFIYNFLDFLNNPDIETFTVERTKEKNEKRIKQGKYPIPSFTNVRVTGKLKIYLNQLKSNPNFSYSYKFDVRGHWRILRADKWKDKKGTKIWIPNYIKGKGIYVKKSYDTIMVKNQHKK